eukprot:COSAG04_NODE_4899_length_1835_cov_1.985599_2_plen_212_part_00
MSRTVTSRIQPEVSEPRATPWPGRHDHCRHSWKNATQIPAMILRRPTSGEGVVLDEDVLGADVHQTTGPVLAPARTIHPCCNLWTATAQVSARFRPYLAHLCPVFSRFLRVFTVSTARFQRAILAAIFGQPQPRFQQWPCGSRLQGDAVVARANHVACDVCTQRTRASAQETGRGKLPWVPHKRSSSCLGRDRRCRARSAARRSPSPEHCC